MAQLPKRAEAQEHPEDQSGQAYPPARRIQSADLFSTAREVEISHGGRIYRLRVTQANKLILTA